MALLTHLPALRFIAIALIIPLVYGEQAPTDEYRVKAAFLFNFARFVEWPAWAFQGQNDPLAIGLLGPNRLGSLLEETVRGKTSGNRSLVVREVANAQDASKCHILFITLEDRRRVRSVLEELKGSSVLTVGEGEDFLANGGVVNFKIKDSRVRIEINPEAAERAQLRISSKLLSLADTSRSAK